MDKKRVKVNGKEWRREKSSQARPYKVYDPIHDETVRDLRYDRRDVYVIDEVHLPIMDAKVSDPTRMAVTGILANDYEGANYSPELKDELYRE